MKWFRSYLSDRTFSVSLGDFKSTSSPLSCGVPQGSILAPILFALYMLLLGSIFRKYGISFHCYADNTHIYIPLKGQESTTIKCLLNCLEDVKAWMALHFLSFNDSKTEVLLLGPGTTCNTNGIDLSTLSTYVKSHRRRLGRTALRNSFDKQVKSVVKSSFFQLRNISKVKKRDCA